MTNFSDPRRNPNDFMTDDVALGPHKNVPALSTPGSYNKGSGLPTPPAGYGKQLGYVPAKSPDCC